MEGAEVYRTKREPMGGALLAKLMHPERMSAEERSGFGRTPFSAAERADVEALFAQANATTPDDAFVANLPGSLVTDIEEYVRTSPNSPDRARLRDAIISELKAFHERYAEEG